jgi:hypothetical protein
MLGFSILHKATRPLVEWKFEEGLVSHLRT